MNYADDAILTGVIVSDAVLFIVWLDSKVYQHNLVWDNLIICSMSLFGQILM